jgi:protein-S-isoprenylcysteine O-methyltransferase Ste14
MISIIVVIVYFFIAGAMFSEIIDDIKNKPSSWWPITGALLFSVGWLVILIWSLIGSFSVKARYYYEKLARTIFKDDSKHINLIWDRD